MKKLKNNFLPMTSQQLMQSPTPNTLTNAQVQPRPGSSQRHSCHFVCSSIHTQVKAWGGKRLIQSNELCEWIFSTHVPFKMRKHLNAWVHYKVTLSVLFYINISNLIIVVFLQGVPKNMCDGFLPGNQDKSKPLWGISFLRNNEQSNILKYDTPVFYFV